MGWMSQNLFRKQAVAQQSERLWGELVLSQPMSYWFISFFFLLVTAFALYFLMVNDYYRKQTVSGLLVPDKGMVIISPPRAGLLVELVIEERQRVVKGDLLFTVQVDQTNNAGGLITEQMLLNIQQQQINLHERSEIERRNYVRLSELVENKRKRLLQQINQYNFILENELELNVIKHNALDRATLLLTQGLLAVADFDRVKATFLSQQNNLQQLQIKLGDSRAELQYLESEQESLVLDQQRGLAVIASEVEELNKQKNSLHADQSNQVLAPIDGIISRVNAQIGQSISPQQEIVALIPDGSNLQAELFVPSQAIAFLEIGQQVNFRFDAFPYQKFGVQSGHLSAISNSSVIPAAPPSALSVNEPLYRVVAELDSQQVQAFGEGVELLPGMMFNADVLLEKRNLLEWLFEPLLSIKGVL